MDKDLLGGVRGGGGYNFQADAFSFVCCLILARQPITWFEMGRGGVPIGAAMETGGPGDDIRISFSGGQSIELQAKRGLKRGPELWTALLRLAQGVEANSDVYGVLLTTTNASAPVRQDLQNAISRVGAGRRDIAGKIGEDLIDRFTAAGVVDIEGVCRRLQIRVEDFGRLAMNEVVQVSILRYVLADPGQGMGALALLKEKAHQLIGNPGYVDVRSLEQLLASSDILIRHSDSQQALNLDRLLRRAREFEATSFPIRADRPHLLDCLFKFAREGGLVIGLPGIGKSRSLDQLITKWEEAGSKAFLVPVDQLGDGSGDDLQQLYSLAEPNLMSYLSRFPVGELPNLLVIDAFDVARDGTLRTNILKLIQRASKGLTGWSVVASVRHYDAATSPDLQAIFPKHGELLSEFERGDIDCRGFFIPALSLEEAEAAIEQNVPTANAFRNASPELREVVRTPFNLKLLYEIAQTSEDGVLSGLSSASDLLGLYWRRVIEQSQTAEIDQSSLRLLVREMVLRQSLNLPKNALPSTLDSTSTRRLLQKGVLVKDITGRRFSFWHNVVFDYAVSELLLPSDANELVQFIEQDFRRVLYLRPSLRYRAASLWNLDRKAFWSDYSAALAEGTRAAKIYSAIVPPSVVVSEARTTDDLAPLLNYPRALAGTLLTLLAEGGWNRKLWSAFLTQVQAISDPQQAFLMSDVCSSCLNDEANVEVRAAVNLVVRRLIEWCATPEKSFFWFGIYTLLPMLVGTLDASEEVSRMLILDWIRQSSGNSVAMAFVNGLARDPEALNSKAPDLLREIYYLKFPLKSVNDFATTDDDDDAKEDRDFDSYNLIQKLPFLLSEDPIAFEPIAVNVVNHLLLNQRSTGKLSSVHLFKFRGNICHIHKIAYEIFGSHGLRDSNTIKASEAFFAHLTESVDQRDRCLDLIAERVTHPWFFQKLFQLSLRQCDFLAPQLAELCQQEEVFLSFGLQDHVCRFLATCSNVLAREGLLIPIIISIAQDDSNESRASMRAQLINCIPLEWRNEVAERYLESAKQSGHVYGIPELYEPVMANVSIISRRDRLKERGVLVEESAQQELLALLDPVQEFSDAIGHHTAKNENLPELIAQMFLLEKKLLEIREVEQLLIESAWTALTRVSNFILSENDTFEPNHLDLFERIILFASRMDLEEGQPSWQDNERRASWSPSPHSEAASGLPVLVYVSHGSEAVNCLTAFLNSNEAPLRYLTLSKFACVKELEPALFWSELDRLSADPNAKVRDAVAYALYPFVEETEYSVPIAQRLVSLEEKFGIHEILCYIIARMAIVNENEWALSLLREITQNASRDPETLRALSFPILDSISAQGIEDAKTEAIYLRLIRWIEDAVRTVAQQLDGCKTATDPTMEGNICADLTRWLSLVALKLMAVFCPEKFNPGSPKEPLTKRQREILFHASQPIFKLLLKGNDSWEKSGRNDISHHILEAVSSCAREEPGPALHFAAASLRSAIPSGILQDPSRLGDYVNIIEIIFTDHREVLTDDKALSDANEILMALIDAGKVDALRLLLRLDGAFRS